MTNSYVGVNILFARLGWRTFDLDVTDAAIGTEDELTELNSGLGLGLEVGDVSDTVLEIRINSEHVNNYILFEKDGATAKQAFAGPASGHRGAAGSEVTAAGLAHYLAGVDYPAFQVRAGWTLSANSAAA